jgi:hypothetical protein
LVVAWCSWIQHNVRFYKKQLLPPNIQSFQVFGCITFTSAGAITIGCTEFQGDEVFVSFGVVPLFTNVPVDLALQVARRRFEADSCLAEHTKLSDDNTVNLPTLCLNATYFTFHSVVYQYVFGTAMGSPFVSVLVADLVKEYVEAGVLRNISTPICFWKQYVDDMCSSSKATSGLPIGSHKHC